MKTKWLVTFKNGTQEVLEIEQTRPTFDHVSAALQDEARRQNKDFVVDFEMAE